MEYTIVSQNEFRQFITLAEIFVEKEKESGRYENIDEYGTTFLERIFIIMNETVKGDIWKVNKIKLCLKAINKIGGMNDEVINSIQKIEYIPNSVTQKGNIHFCIVMKDDIKEIQDNGIYSEGSL